MVYYFTGIGINIALGLIFLPFANIPFRANVQKAKREKGDNVVIRPESIQASPAFNFSKNIIRIDLFLINSRGSVRLFKAGN
jgi:hypothetical protein